jgi:hypothetical protein
MPLSLAEKTTESPPTRLP